MTLIHGQCATGAESVNSSFTWGLGMTLAGRPTFPNRLEDACEILLTLQECRLAEKGVVQMIGHPAPCKGSLQ